MSKLKRLLHRHICVYTRQNASLLEITCHGSFVYFSDDEAEDEASSEEENDETCAVCGVGGTLICCDNCPLSYHLACAQPPLKKVPKRKWLCQICSGEDSKAGKIKFLAAPKSK